MTRSGNKVLINKDLADYEWEQNTDATKRLNVKDPRQKYVPSAEPVESPAVEDRKKPGVMALREASETIKLRMARLDLEEREGKLVDAEVTKDEVFKYFRGARDSLLGIPNRVSAIFAGTTDQFVIHRKLTEEIEKALRELAEWTGNQAPRY